MSTLGAIGIVCNRPADSLRFYELLGLAFEKLGDGDHYEAKTSSGLRVMLDSLALVQSFDPSYVKADRGGVTLCFEQSSPKAVDAMYERITSAGFASQKAPWDAFWGQRYASVLDPDGNQIDLFAAL